MATDRGVDATRLKAQSPGFAALATGTRLDGRYVIDSVIAAGGFGITYVAHHETLAKIFAVKEHFPRQFAIRDGATSDVRPSDEPTFRWTLDRFMQEGRSLARCRHPGVVGVADVFQANGTAYMVLEYEEGQSLKNWLDGLGRPPTQAEMDRLLAPLLDALEYVHGQGLLHRDLAPDNIIVRTDGTPCLIDFGAARQAVAEVSQVMSAIVKSGFSPPEQYTRAGKAQGAWSDVYALGSTVYRAVSGKVPPEATERQIDDEYVPLAQAAASPGAYRASFLAAVDAALLLRYSSRPQSVAAWREMLLGEAKSADVAPVAPVAPVTPGPATGTKAAPAPADAKLASGEIAENGGDAGKAKAGPETTWNRIASPPAQSASGPAMSPRAVAYGVAGLFAIGVAGMAMYRIAQPPPPPVVDAAQSQADLGQQTPARVPVAAAESEQPAEPARPAAPTPSFPFTILTEKDQGRFARLAASRQTAFGYAERSTNGKSQAALREAKALLALPAIAIAEDQLVGNWRCRTYSIGGSLADDDPKSDLGTEAGTVFNCRIARDRNGLVLSKTTGAFRRLGRLLPIDGGGTAMLYAGTNAPSDEQLPAYPAADAYHNETGILQRVSPTRVRIELPEPTHSSESRHDVVELVKTK